ncbi:MAG: hypothetical protein ABH950_08440 [Candidatus Altiarchaeota archaeon]
MKWYGNFLEKENLNYPRQWSRLAHLEIRLRHYTGYRIMFVEEMMQVLLTRLQRALDKSFDQVTV